MRKWLYILYQNRYFLIFITFFAYSQSIYSRLIVREKINAYTFTPEGTFFTLFEAIVLFSITFYFIKKWKKSDILTPKELLKIFGISLITHPLLMLIIGFIVALMLNKIQQNFNSETIANSSFAFFLNGFIYDSYFITYYYHKQIIVQKQQLSFYHHAISESKIQQLKSQINPHFLFNNLNILDQLIEEDKIKASQFLYDFSEIYRYVLRTSDERLISLKDEIAFLEKYFSLIKHKYGCAYQLFIHGESLNYFIVPMTLQLLIENAIQHNLGTENNPIIISVILSDDISILNNINLIRNPKAVSGRGLKNLKEQYVLLSKKSIEIQRTSDTFLVKIPFLNSQDYD